MATLDALPSWIQQRYEITDHLGHGKWTEVFLAHDRVRRDPFAIKILLEAYRDVPRIRSRFLTEAKAMSRLIHPNIIRIFDVGGALGEDPLTPHQAAQMTSHILAGLAEAHAAGVVHRGISPDSVLLDEHGIPKISDFGVARLEQNPHALMTISSESLGDYFYAAPEQLRNARDATVRSDIYAVGATLLYALRGKDPKELALSAFMEDFWESVVPALRPWLAKSAAYEPEGRYETVAQMSADLDDLLRHWRDPKGDP
ncbi:MAG: serine/threonine protein kinase [Deltaproteobacteria bacterium]|nr:serine/threonine protein kinase [Deltaproteobacteria bacterium]